MTVTKKIRKDKTDAVILIQKDMKKNEYVLKYTGGT
jgi:hypothetical protein